MWISKIIGCGSSAGCSDGAFPGGVFIGFAWTFSQFWRCSDDLQICLRGLRSPASRCGTAQFFVGAAGYITCFIGGEKTLLENIGRYETKVDCLQLIF